MDLLDRAAENGIDTTRWIHRDTLASAANELRVTASFTQLMDQRFRA